jgi:hypothetical protein
MAFRQSADGSSRITLHLKEGTYHGEVLNGQPHGKGILKFNDGSVYEGTFENGTRTGYGKMIWPNGEVYEGASISHLLKPI